MRYIADLHIHSPFSRATSKQSTLAGLAGWALVKGIDVVATGDFTHPAWFGRLREELEPAEPGFFRLKAESVASPLAGCEPVLPRCRFVLTAEISSIYKRGGRVRKIHNVLLVPDFDSASRLNARLAGIGNIESDGRPILGLDSRHLLEILLETAPEGFLVPAHIWTPWFSLFGSKSGFDTIEDCFGDLAEHIFALETGLSSDPDMNRLISGLDRYTLISNSDSHSPGKLGREANLFDTDFDFFSMRQALKNPATGFLGTIEFFPEEGKYHLDGHRKCGIRLEPEETRRLRGICPECHRPLTIGVMHRVLELADRQRPSYSPGMPRFHSLIPLAEVLGEILGRGPATKGVMRQYDRAVRMFGSEFALLLHTPVEEIDGRHSPALARAVERIRAGRVTRKGGYDGEFGVIRVFEDEELRELGGQISLFAPAGRRKPSGRNRETAPRPELFAASSPPCRQRGGNSGNRLLNPEQEAAVTAGGGHLLITAGPGTGKTHTLINRLVRLLNRPEIRAAGVAAITFTNRAAAELRERLEKEVPERAGAVFVGTFHAFCLHWLREFDPELKVAGPEQRELLRRTLFPGLTAGEREAFRLALEDHFRDPVAYTASPEDDRVRRYLDELDRLHAMDLEEIIPRCVARLIADPVFAGRVRDAAAHLFVDEFQDLNRMQYEFVRLLAPTGRIFAIGDPDQAIYGFRGSSPEYFFRFMEEFGAKRLSLVRNYRSAPAIIEAAARVIASNPDRAGGPLQLIPQLDRQVEIECYCAPTPAAEAEYVVRRIEELMGGISHFSIGSGRGGEMDAAAGFNDFAVLYRLSRQAKELRHALARRGIPFQVVDIVPFFMQKKMRAAYYWLQLAAVSREHRSAAHFLSLLRDIGIRGLGGRTLEELEKTAAGKGDTAFFRLLAGLTLPPEGRERLAELLSGLERFQEAVAGNGIAEPLLKSLVLLGLPADDPDVRRLLALAGSFGGDLVGLAGYLYRNSSAVVYDDQAEAVTLMTLHAAKGLEFPVVFVTGLEEGLLPYTDGRREEPGKTKGVVEERRLFYVGMTRAREALVLSWSATRTLHGRAGRRLPSRFLAEIPEKLMKNATQPLTQRRRILPSQLKLF